MISRREFLKFLASLPVLGSVPLPPAVAAEQFPEIEPPPLPRLRPLEIEIDGIRFYVRELSLDSNQELIPVSRGGAIVARIPGIRRHALRVTTDDPQAFALRYRFLDGGAAVVRFILGEVYQIDADGVITNVELNADVGMPLQLALSMQLFGVKATALT